MTLKKSLKKVATPKPLTMEAYKEIIGGLANNVDFVPLCLTNGETQYSLGSVYNIMDDSVTFPFDRLTNMLFIKKMDVELSMWFEYKKPLITWP